MATYDPNTNPPGAVVIYTSTSANAPGSSTQIPLIVGAVDPDYLKDTLDGYVAVNTNTNASVVKFNAPAAVVTNQYTGQYIYSDALDEAVLIDGNTAAAQSAEVTVYLATPFSSAVTTSQTVNIRPWKKLYDPVLFSSLDEMQEKFIDLDANGDYDWTNSEQTLDAITTFKRNGGASYWFLPVESSSSSTALVGNLSCSANADFVVAFENMGRLKPNFIMLTYSHFEATLSSANWGSVVDHWCEWANNHMTDSTVDPDLTPVRVVADTPSASTSSAVTFKTSTLSYGSDPILILTHGKHNVDDVLNPGRTREVNAAPAWCGAANTIATKRPESFGHSFSGKYMKVNGVKSLSEKLTTTNAQTLGGNGINAIVNRNGYIFRDEWTAKKTLSTAATYPLEYAHVAVSRDQIWKASKLILDDMLDEQNTQEVRNSAIVRINSLLEDFRSRKIIREYSVSDSTSSSDESLGVARLAVSLRYPVGIRWVEFTVNSRL